MEHQFSIFTRDKSSKQPSELTYEVLIRNYSVKFIASMYLSLFLCNCSDAFMCLWCSDVLISSV